MDKYEKWKTHSNERMYCMRITKNQFQILFDTDQPYSFFCARTVNTSIQTVDNCDLWMYFLLFFKHEIRRFGCNFYARDMYIIICSMLMLRGGIYEMRICERRYIQNTTKYYLICISICIYTIISMYEIFQAFRYIFAFVRIYTWSINKNIWRWFIANPRRAIFLNERSMFHSNQ